VIERAVVTPGAEHALLVRNATQLSNGEGGFEPRSKTLRNPYVFRKEAQNPAHGPRLTILWRFLSTPGRTCPMRSRPPSKQWSAPVSADTLRAEVDLSAALAV
jgi:hypothetical protein